MATNPIKFSLGVSVLAHGLVISGAVWLRQFQHSPTTVMVGAPATLELIAAPNSTEPANVPPTTPPIPQPVVPAAALPLPPPPGILEKPVALASVETATLPPALSPIGPIKPAAVTAVAAAAPVPPPPTPLERGDASSALPGHDHSAVAGKPTAKAQPDYLKNPEPVYPLAARRRRQEGLVLLSVRVSPTGHAATVSLKQSSGFPLLDDAALTQVRDWEFAPARIGSLAVESEIEVPVRFKLTN